MDRLAWAYRGPLATGHDFIVMDEADLDQAVRDDWAQPVDNAGEGMHPSNGFRAIEPGPHKAAEAYAQRLPGYATRELRPAPAPAPKKPEADADEDGEDRTGKRRPSKK